MFEGLRKLRVAQEKASNEGSGSLVSMENVELRVPNEVDVENCYDKMTVTEEDMLNNDEFLIVLFKVTQMND